MGNMQELTVAVQNSPRNYCSWKGTIETVQESNGTAEESTEAGQESNVAVQESMNGTVQESTVAGQ